MPNLRDAGQLATVHDQRVIAVRAGLPPAREQHVVGHELGHWILEREGYRDEDVVWRPLRGSLVVLGDTLRRWARGRAAPGVRKVRLRDDPRRVVLDPEEIEHVG